jgi:hypothetical protein
MNNIFELLSMETERSGQGFAQPRLGIITSSDSSTATAKVLLQPEGVLTGWIPVLTPWAGSGWGMNCPPSPGDQVLVISQEGNSEHGIIVGCLFSNSARPPQAELGEITMTHQSGASIRFLNSGTISLIGDLHVSGDVYDAHGTLSRLRNDYNSHTHHTSNGGLTSTPLQVD